MNNTVDVVSNVAQNAPIANGQGGSWLMIGYCLLVMGLLYFLMILPNKKRMAEYQKMLDSIKVGNRIMAAGIYGTVKKIDQTTIDMEIAKGVVVTVSKHAVASVEQ